MARRQRGWLVHLVRAHAADCDDLAGLRQQVHGLSIAVESLTEMLEQIGVMQRTDIEQRIALALTGQRDDDGVTAGPRGAYSDDAGTIPYAIASTAHVPARAATVPPIASGQPMMGYAPAGPPPRPPSAPWPAPPAPSSVAAPQRASAPAWPAPAPPPPAPPAPPAVARWQAGAAPPPARAATSSAFVACAVCGKRVLQVSANAIDGVGDVCDACVGAGA